MIGRNDPCHCGSGKKYKKCCLGKEEVTREDVVMEEISRILSAFSNQYPKQADYTAYAYRAQNWSVRTLQRLPEQIVRIVAWSEFVFNERLDIWQSYLKSVKRAAVRPAVLDILNGWETPRVVLADVARSTEEMITYRDVLTDELIDVRNASGRQIVEGTPMYMYLFPMQDGTNVTIFEVPLPVRGNEMFDDLKAQYEASGQEEQAYLQDVMLDFWVSLAVEDEALDTKEEEAKTEAVMEAELEDVLVEETVEEAPKEEVVERAKGVPSVQIDVLNGLEQFMNENDVSNDSFYEQVESYLVACEPKARKPEAILAGMIRYGIESGALAHKTTWTALGEQFDVSPSSLAKYAKEMKEYVACK